MFEKHVFGPFSHNAAKSFNRADLEFYGINHFRPSYTVHIYFNDTEVEGDTCSESRESYAGSFSIFGHPECVGDEGHCDIPQDRRRFDDRPSHPLTPAFKRVIVTEALRKIVDDGAKLTITLIAAASSEPDDIEGDKLLDFTGMQLVTFV